MIPRPMLLGRMADADLAELGDECVVEPKIDGWRCLAELRDNAVTIKTRQGTHITAHFPALAQELGQLPLDCVLDGELCYVDEEGISRLHQMTGQTGKLVYYVFDVLSIEGADLTGQPLHKRRRLLEMLVDSRLCPDYVDVVAQLPGSHAAALYEEYVGSGGEGVVVKDRESLYYTDSRRNLWRKCKPNNQD